MRTGLAFGLIGLLTLTATCLVDVRSVTGQTKPPPIAVPSRLPAVEHGRLGVVEVEAPCPVELPPPNTAKTRSLPDLPVLEAKRPAEPKPAASEFSVTPLDFPAPAQRVAPIEH